MKPVILTEARFLIVDDEIVNVRVLERMLQEWGCLDANVTGITKPQEAVSLYRSFQPDILLLDLMMPEMDGFQVMQQLRPLIPDGDYFPILILTADTSGESKRKALSAGADDFLTKPFDMVELCLRISNLIETRFLHLQLRDQNQILEQKVAERTAELVESQEQLRALAVNLTRILEEERTAIAREVHDELGQALTGLKMDLAWLDQRLMADGALSNGELQQKIRSMLQGISTTIQLGQRIATKLRPAVLDDLGLEAAIEWQVQEFQERTNMQCDYVSSLGNMALPHQLSTAVFRILQESLTNIARHAAASRISVLLEENAGYLMLEVQDNGRGMKDRRAAKTKSLGLLGMRERARLIGGEVTVNGVTGQGTTVTVRIPLHQDGNL